MLVMMRIRNCIAIMTAAMTTGFYACSEKTGIPYDGKGDGTAAVGDSVGRAWYSGKKYQ